MAKNQLSKRWLYTFITVAIASLATSLIAIYLKEWVIAAGTGLVFGAQIINIIRWKR